MSDMSVSVTTEPKTKVKTITPAYAPGISKISFQTPSHHADLTHLRRP
eukprot:CAMPEP_0183376424 /NCGR_PEP_ID=MMETSP0164_2-20130417/120236_1 /TAXON_ID=221442 /ORGANISM="Coccolithus pelagicus ssp braarudi, Strain PLY182g" /LENGTH=47 /DNA_ID= /DNA_START= /DNA_END= /DNA_ORIENTATION=